MRHRASRVQGILSRGFQIRVRGIRAFTNGHHNNSVNTVCCLLPFDSRVAQLATIHFFAKLLGIFPDTLAAKTVATAGEPVDIDLLSHIFIERQKTLVL